MQRILKVNVIILSLILVTSSPAYAATSFAALALGSSISQHQVPGPKNQRQNTNNLIVNSPQQAVQIAQRNYPGKVLKVQSSNVNGHPGYRLKLLTNDGVIFYVSVDATNGSVTRN